MPFSIDIKRKAMIACGRSCCICHKFCGNNMEVHHIKAHVDGGEDTFENAIPLCFDCHAEVRQYDSKHPKGIRFTESELKEHRDRWYTHVEHGTFEQSKNSSSKKSVEPIRIMRQRGYQEIMLFQVSTGKELLSYIQGSSAMEYNYDDVNTEDEAILISNTFQNISEVLDEDYFLMEPYEYVMKGFELNSLIKDLESAGFSLFCAKEKRTITGGVEPASDFPTLLVQIRRTDSPEILHKEASF